MKRFKKLTALFVALAMMIALMPSAFAATANLTITGTSSGREYKVYQVLKGDSSGTTLSNIALGSDVDLNDGKTLEDLINALTAENADATTVLDYISLKDISDSYSAWADTLVIPDLDTGYYLIEEVTKTTVGDQLTLSKFMIKVVGDAEVQAKSGTVTSEKKVMNKDDSNSVDSESWQDSADYNVNDLIPFQLKATLPDNYADFTSFKLVFHDIQSDGLDYPETGWKVFVSNNGVEQEITNYAVMKMGDEENNPCTFHVTIEDLKSITKDDSAKDLTIDKYSEIYVRYYSKLNGNAEIGSAGNPNEMYLEFSNNPRISTDTGTTPKDKVTVFTFNLVVEKVNGEKQPLSGAKFALYKKNGSSTLEDQYELVGTGSISETEIKDTDENITAYRFTWECLGAGEYKLVEETTPAGYNTAADLYFTIEATFDETADDPQLKTLVIKDKDGKTISGNDGSFNVGMVSVEGSDETTGSKFSGVISTQIINNSGSTLPETGGIGTTIFYTVGGIMVVAAVVLLITKKRMKATK